MVLDAVKFPIVKKKVQQSEGVLERVVVRRTSYLQTFDETSESILQVSIFLRRFVKIIKTLLSFA